MVPRYPHSPNSEFLPGSALSHRFQSADGRHAVVYVLVVGLLYAAIILVLVGTNIHRFRKKPLRAQVPKNQTPTDSETKQKKKKGIKKNCKTKLGAAEPEATVVQDGKTANFSRSIDSSTEKECDSDALLENGLHHADESTQSSSSDVEDVLETGCVVESIEVTYSTDRKKPKYSRSIVKETDCHEHLGFKLNGSPLYVSDRIGGVRPLASGSKATGLEKGLDKCRDSFQAFGKVSTMVVSASDVDIPVNRQQRVRVGLTTEEQIRPKALLEMAGDELTEPVPV